MLDDQFQASDILRVGHDADADELGPDVVGEKQTKVLIVDFPQLIALSCKDVSLILFRGGIRVKAYVLGCQSHRVWILRSN